MRILGAWTWTGILTGVLVLVTASFAERWSPSQGGANPKPATETCGPPHYCARTDRKAVPYPGAPPALGPAGSVVIDPDFHSRILRATDASVDQARSGTPFHTPASGEQNSWNASSTKFYAGDTGGGFWLFDFDPSVMSVHSSGRIKFPWSGLEFSYTQGNILYGVTGRNPTFQQYDLSSGKVTTINDFSSCVQLGDSDGDLSFSVSADDNRLLGVVGPQQDKDYLLYVYDRKRGCRWYNTATGEIGGQWGPTGRISGSAPPSLLIHNAELAKSGDYVVIGSQQVARGRVIWQVGTLNVTVCAGPEYQCLGHVAVGYSHMLNSSNSSHPLDFIKRPLDDPTAKTHIMQLPPLTGWYDYHLSWNHIDPGDDTPACFSTYHPTNPDTPGAPLLVNGPWENEIDCVSTDRAPATVWRFAHTYSTGRSFWATPRGNVSRDGRFYMFTSDWENELGKDPKGRYRTDVFIVELR